MSDNSKVKGVYQLDNGYWGYRFTMIVNGKTVSQRRVKDESGNPFKTEKKAEKARLLAMAEEQTKANKPQTKIIQSRTFEEVYKEYCDNGRYGKAYATIKKQDSLWNNHIKDKFGKRCICDVTVAEINDYLDYLYHVENRAYTYTESFLKMFYLIFGQAYTRGHLSLEDYDRMCNNKDTKIHMPKMKTDEDTDIVYFNKKEIKKLDEYFADTNAEMAYMLGKYCGLRINECYGLIWDDIYFENGVINIQRQMSYQDGIIKLVPLKTHNAKRKIYMSKTLIKYLKEKKEKRVEYQNEMLKQREQNAKNITSTDGAVISSLELVNTLPNGKIQTVNSMKYHAQKIKKMYGITFKYHFLRHTYGTMLATLNTPEYLLCNQMGHSSSNVTHKYYVAISEQGVRGLKRNLDKIK